MDGLYDTISGGDNNFVYGYGSTIRGGNGVNIHGDYAFVLSAKDSTVGGKVVMGEYSDLHGVSEYAVLIGGTDNTVSGNVNGKPNQVCTVHPVEPADSVVFLLGVLLIF